jgi:hypothetical protein
MEPTAILTSNPIYEQVRHLELGTLTAAKAEALNRYINVTIGRHTEYSAAPPCIAQRRRTERRIRQKAHCA